MTARIIKVVTGIRCAPSLKQALESPTSQVAVHQIFRNVRQPGLGLRRVLTLIGAVERELPVNPHLQLATASFERPRV
jgi:hypothetical protein